MDMDLALCRQPPSTMLPFPGEDLPQLTSESFNSYMNAWLRLPQHPRPTAARDLRILSDHPLFLAARLWVGGMFIAGDSSSREPAKETYRIGRLMKSLLSNEVPRVVNEIGMMSSPTRLPMTPDNMALLMVLCTVPRVLLKLGQIGAGMALHGVGLDMVRGIGPQLSQMLMEQQAEEASWDIDPENGQTLVNSTQLSDYLVQQQWIRAIWSMMGVEMARTGIQLKSKLIVSPLRDLPGIALPVADHALMRSTSLHFSLLEIVPTLKWPAPVAASSAPTYRELLGPLISNEDSDSDLRREVLRKHVTNLAVAGPTPLHLAALYLMAMVSQFNWWLEHEAHLTMLSVITAEELLAHGRANIGADGDRHSSSPTTEGLPAIVLEAVARRRALLSGFAAVNEALPADVKALDQSADIAGIVVYAAQNWSPTVIHGISQLFESFIWLHTGELLLRCPEPFSDKERVLVSDPEWNFWFSSSTFVTASTHATILSKYAESASNLSYRLMQSRQQQQQQQNAGLWGSGPAVAITQDSTGLELAAKVSSFTPLFSYSLIYAAWLHIVVLNFCKEQQNAGPSSTANGSPSRGLFESATIEQFEKNAQSCIGILSTNAWKQVDSHWKVLLRMMVLSGTGPSLDEQAELLLQKEVPAPDSF